MKNYEKQKSKIQSTLLEAETEQVSSEVTNEEPKAFIGPLTPLQVQIKYHMEKWLEKADIIIPGTRHVCDIYCKH